jgi:hypothetical protein
MMARRSLRQAGLAKVFEEPVSHSHVAIGLGLNPMANPEMGDCCQIELGLFPRFLEQAELRQGRGQQAPAFGAICCLVPQSPDRIWRTAASIIKCYWKPGRY